MSNELQFTRYLYEKDEVTLSLIMCVLNKNEEEAVFWAYELYYSGFQTELVAVFWSIYYDFYYTLNPSFEKYLQTKFKNNLVLTIDSVNCISMIVNNFMIRPHNMDVFILKQLVNICDFDKADIQDYIIENNFEVMRNELLNVLRTKDYMMLASYILTDVKETHLCDAFKVALEYFVTDKGIKIDKKYLAIDYEKYPFDKSVLILSRIMYYFTLANNKKMGKNIYVHVEPEDVVLYETIYTNANLSPRKILPLAKIYAIDSYNYLSLFDLKRETQDIKTAYYYDWLYYASFSPLWNSRILKYNGVIDEKNKKIVFDDDDIDEFYDVYGYEPDEQTADVENKTIQDIRKERTWQSFYKKHNIHGVVEIEDDILSSIYKMTYK
jgi:hypothetical protein